MMGLGRCGVYIYIYIYTYTHTMENYSAIKKNHIMPFAATWMEVETLILRVRKRKMNTI